MQKICLSFLLVMFVASPSFAGKGYTGNTQPAICAKGDFWIDGDGTSAERLYICESTNTWVKHLGVGPTSNPSFASVHASGGNLAAANKQVTKAWQTGLGYTADATSVIHGGEHYICTSTHTAGSTTEPGVGASWATAWKLGTGVSTAAEVTATPFSTYESTNAQALMEEIDTALRSSLSAGFDSAGNYTLTGTWDFTGATVTGVTAAPPSWMPATGPTAANQIIQATGAGVSIWTDIVNGLINDAGTAVDDLLSAAEINTRIATSAETKQNTLGYTPENAANKGQVNGYASLGTDGLVPTAQLPAIQSSLEVPSLAEAQEGTAIEPRAWTAQRVAQAIVALAPAGTGGEDYFEIDGGSSASLTFTGLIDGGASI